MKNNPDPHIMKEVSQFREPLYVIRCAIWYHLYNLKNLENIHGGVLHLVKL